MTAADAVWYGGIDPGETPGYCALGSDGSAYLGTEPYQRMRYAVLAVEGQYLASARGAWHKGRKVRKVGHKTIPTLAFRAGRQSLLAGAAARTLRLAPEVWRFLIGLGGLSAEVVINHLRRELGAAANGQTDDAIESYGLAKAARVVGPDATKGAGWVAKRQDAYGWWDVSLAKAKPVRVAKRRVR